MRVRVVLQKGVEVKARQRRSSLWLCGVLREEKQKKRIQKHFLELGEDLQVPVGRVSTCQRGDSSVLVMMERSDSHICS